MLTYSVPFSNSDKRGMVSTNNGFNTTDSWFVMLKS